MIARETPANNVVKGSKPQKGKYNAPYRAFFSDKDTLPYNDVVRYNPKTKEHIIVKGLSDEEKIAEGSQPPYQYKNETIKGKFENEITGELEERVIKTIGRFQKTRHEREEYELEHSCKKQEGRWAPPSGRPAKFRGTLIVHLKNFRKKSDYKDFKQLAEKNPQGFKTTYSFPAVAENEIHSVIATIVRLDRNKKDDKVMNYVTKYFFNGKTQYGEAN